MTKINKAQKYTKNFTLSNNAVIQDKRLSWKARGIFIYLFSLPDNWNFREREIAKHSSNGISTLTSGIKELQKYHYLLIKRDMKGHTHWIISDRSMNADTKPRHENPDKDNPDMENPYKENRDELQSTNHNKVLKEQSTHRNRKNSVREKTKYDTIIQYYDQHLVINNLHGSQYKYLVHSIDSWIYRFSIRTIEHAINIAQKTNMKHKLYNPISYISKVLNNLAERENDIKAKRKQESFNDDYVSPDEQKKEIHQQIKDMVERSKHGKLFRD